MKSDVRGCSTCPVGEERFEWYPGRVGVGSVRLLQYDYRTPGGELFSCVAVSLDNARRRLDRWLEDRADRIQAVVNEAKVDSHGGVE
jgi:hypothetical protein